jgi:ABC-2 type transport system ATP-binding protein
VTVTLSAPPNGLVARLEAIPGVREVQPADSAGHAVHVHTDARGASVPRIVAETGRELVDLSVTEPSLETVFISLTGRELRD